MIAMKKIQWSTNQKRFFKKFRKNKLAMFGMAICVLVLFVTIAGPVISPYEASTTSVKERFSPPSAAHWLGTDELGRDTLSRIIAGARITVIVGVCAVMIALVLGTIFGLIAGYYGGIVDTVISGFMDALWSFPAIILALAITAVLGASIRNIFIAIGIVYTPNFCRLVRSRALSIRETEYVQGARALA